MIVITTPTGGIGSQVLADLLDTTEESVRVVVRDPDRLAASTRDRVDVVRGSHGDPGVLARALDGADAVFWVAPPSASQPPERTYTGFTRPAAAAFARLGITHVVGVSALGRGTPYAQRAGLVTASLAMDDLIAGSGPAYRALACPTFFDNQLEDVDSIRAGVLTGQVRGDLRVPGAATRDIASVGAGLLRERDWTGFAEVPVLGPADLSADEMAATLSEVLGRPVRYQRQSFEAMTEELLGYGLDPDAVAGIVDMMRAKDAGLDLGVARTAALSTATTYRSWAAEVLRPAIDRTEASQ